MHGDNALCEQADRNELLSRDRRDRREGMGSCSWHGMQGEQVSFEMLQEVRTCELIPECAVLVGTA